MQHIALGDAKVLGQEAEGGSALFCIFLVSWDR